MAACAVATIISPAAFATPITATNTTNFTTSSAEIDTTIDTPVTHQVNTFSTELIARLQGGSVLFDQTIGASFSDPLFQSEITSAESVLTGNGAVSFLGPNLLSSNHTLGSSSQTVTTGQTLTNLYTNAEQFVGPITIPVDGFGVCQSAPLDPAGHPIPSGCTLVPDLFILGSGQTDLDTFVLSHFDITTTTTTTNTDLLTQVYELDGVPAAVASVPEPPSWTIILVGLLGLGFIFRRRNFLTMLGR
jgi:hypothetical protein